jgi:type 1 glutamine amidotransferase
MKLVLFFLFILPVALLPANALGQEPVRILVITGGHDYDEVTFTGMLEGLGDGFSFEIEEFPDAFNLFLPENRDKYDVIVFYHMWQTISTEQKKAFSECIMDGKPLVVLHHSICAFDGWNEYIRIIGGKYFHIPTVVDDREYPASTYEHDRHITLSVVDTLHPVTKGLRDFELLDETYKGFYLSPDVTPLLTTRDPSSTPVVGWAHRYGKARVVTIQSGHDAPTFKDQNYRKLLRQALLWVFEGVEP